MQRLSSVLVVLDRGARDAALLAKSVVLARKFGARIELFSCDAERGYAFRHTYDPRGLAKARQACLTDLSNYLQGLREPLNALDIEVSIDAACESPLYEGIVRKVCRSAPDLVLKAVTLEESSDHVALNPNDWQLVRACPVPLLLSRAGIWPARPHFAVAVDRCDAETAPLVEVILQTAEYLRAGCGGDIEVVLGDHSGAKARARRAQAVRLRRLGRELHIGADRIQIVTGDAHTVLPACVGKRGHHILVLGALEHREGATELVATLARKLINALDCDFILIKPSDYGIPVLDSSTASTRAPWATSDANTGTARFQ